MIIHYVGFLWYLCHLAKYINNVIRFCLWQNHEKGQKDEITDEFIYLIGQKAEYFSSCPPFDKEGIAAATSYGTSLIQKNNTLLKSWLIMKQILLYRG